MVKIYHEKGEKKKKSSQPSWQLEEFDNSQRDGHPIYILLDGSLHRFWSGL
jgi:hypothetical protein